MLFQSMLRFAITFFMAFLFCCIGLFADVQKSESQSSEVKVPKSVLEAAADASLSWLRLVDKGQYPQSWDQSSVIMKMSMPKDQWIDLLKKTRQPLGSVRSRDVLDERTAKNPHGLPKGDYIVMYYKTSFSGRATAHELVTLFLEDGEWRVLTYQAN